MRCQHIIKKIVNDAISASRIMAEKARYEGKKWVRFSEAAYRPEACDVVVECCEKGMRDAEIAKFLKVAVTTLRLWEKNHEEFRLAMEYGRTLHDAFWEEQGRTNLDSKTFNCRLWEVNVKNRMNWRDRQDVNLGGQTDNPIVALDSPEAAKEYYLRKMELLEKTESVGDAIVDE